MGFVARVTRKTGLSGTILVVRHPKKLKNLVDKHNLPFYSNFAVHRQQIEGVESEECEYLIFRDIVSTTVRNSARKQISFPYAQQCQRFIESDTYGYQKIMEIFSN
jgi:hypothetical protein